MRLFTLRPLAMAALYLSLAACGGGGDGGCSTCGFLASAPSAPAAGDTAPAQIPPAGDTAPAQIPPAGDTAPVQIPPAGDTAPAQIPPAGDTAPPTYAIGGTLTGLADNIKLVLLDNGGDALTLVANGAFSFAAPVAFNTAYAVTVGTQPLWQ